MKCDFCGNEMDWNEDHEFACKTCNVELEDRMNFSGYNFHFMNDVTKRRRFKTLPYPTRDDLCENCAFKVQVTDKHFDHKTRKPCKNLEDFEYDVCWLLPIGYCHDTRSVMFMFVKKTSRCKRFKKRKGKARTQEVMIVL